MTRTQKQTLQFSFAIAGGLLAFTLIAASGKAEAKMKTEQGAFKACLEKVNETCKREHNPLDDRDGFSDCLEKQYEKQKCSEKTEKRQGDILKMAEEPYNPLDDLPKFPEKLL